LTVGLLALGGTLRTGGAGFIDDSLSRGEHMLGNLDLKFEVRSICGPTTRAGMPLASRIP